MISRNLLTAFQLSARAAVAAAAAMVVAHLLGLDHPLYAMIAAVIVTDLSPVRTPELAVPRLAGTALGAGAGAMLAFAMPPGEWAAAVGIFAAMFLAQALRLHDAAKLAGYVCGIVLLEHHSDAWLYALQRFFETVLGIIAAVLVSLLPKLITYEQSERGT